VSVLDKLVANERPRDESSPGQGSPLDFPSPEPWPDPVDGAELLNELRDTVREYVVCSDHKIIAVVLWIVATWFEPAAQVAPILNNSSPINRCGKTTLLDIVGKLSKRALMAASITPAALFRTIEICLPTLIIDEADSFFGANDELRGVVDSGHTRQAAFVIRTVGEDHEPRQFSTWSFKAVSGIGKRAVTIEDRSIAIDLERKLRTEQASRLRHAPRGLFTALQQKLCRWSGDNLDAAAASRPSIPGALDDRQQDNWEILIAVADLAGGDWPAAARNAAISLSNNSKEDTETLGVQLLHDVKTIVDSSKDNGVYSI
jgi:putative DNA primase/helicase